MIYQMKRGSRKYFKCGDFNNYANALNTAKRYKRKGYGRYQIYKRSDIIGTYYELWMEKKGRSY